MRVVWKDSSPKPQKSMKYRGHMVEGYGDGWIVNIMDDNNIYKYKACALNAIDEYECGFGQKGIAKRVEYGIQIIGKKIKGVVTRTSPLFFISRRIF